MNSSRPRRIGRLLIAIPIQVGRVARAALREFFGAAFRGCRAVGEAVIVALAMALGTVVRFFREWGDNPAIPGPWGVGLYGVLAINAIVSGVSGEGFPAVIHLCFGILWVRMLITAAVQSYDTFTTERVDRLWHARVRAERRNSRAQTR